MGNFKITLESSTTATTKTGSSRRSLVLALVILAQFMIVVDFTIVQVALPSIGREFGVSVNGLQWLVTAYGLTLAGFLILSGQYPTTIPLEQKPLVTLHGLLWACLAALF